MRPMKKIANVLSNEVIFCMLDLGLADFIIYTLESDEGELN